MINDWSIIEFRNADLQIIDGDRGKNYPKKEEMASEGHCLFLNTGNIKNDCLDFSNCDFISMDKDNKLRKGKLQRFDSILTTRGTVGSVGFFSKNVHFNHIRINSGMVIIRPGKSLDPTYLYQLLKSPVLKSQYLLYSSGSAQPQLPIKDLKRINLLLPPLPTQRKIAAVLSAYDDLIENNTRRIALLERMAEELYKEWFVRMRFPGHESVRFEKGIPEGWEVKKIGEVYKTTSGGTPSRKHSTYYDGDIPWIKTGELRDSFIFKTDEFITEDGLNNSSAKIVPPYSVVIAMYGATIGQLGITTQPATTNQACCVFIDNIHNIDYPYTFHLLKSIKESLISIAFGGAQQNISQTVIKNYAILFPEVNIIHQFNDFVLPYFKQIENLSRTNQNLKTTRDRLLTRLISGKLSVEELDIAFPPSMQEEPPSNAEQLRLPLESMALL